MRSVKRRKPAPSRAAVKRRGATRGRVAEAREAFNKRKAPRDNIISRTWNAVRARLSFRRPFLLITGSLLALTVIGALFIGGHVSRTFQAMGGGVQAVLDRAGFGVSYTPISGNNRTPPSTIYAALGFADGQPIFGVDLPAARARLMQLPWVADAEVRRRYPDTISVSLVEKLPFALWLDGGHIWVVERGGGVITDVGLDEFVKLPKLAGAGAPRHGADIIEAVALHRAIKSRVKVIERVSDRRWNLRLDNGVVVKLPEQDWQSQLDVLEQLIVDKGILERDIKTIDLRSPQNYFFRLRGGGEEGKKTRENAA